MRDNIRVIADILNQEIDIKELLTDNGIEIKGNMAKSIYKDEKTPSMSVDYNGSNRVHDFSTGQGDDLIGVYMHLNGYGNYDFPNAVKELAENYGFSHLIEENTVDYNKDELAHLDRKPYPKTYALIKCSYNKDFINTLEYVLNKPDMLKDKDNICKALNDIKINYMKNNIINKNEIIDMIVKDEKFELKFIDKIKDKASFLKGLDNVLRKYCKDKDDTYLINTGLNKRDIDKYKYNKNVSKKELIDLSKIKYAFVNCNILESKRVNDIVKEVFKENMDKELINFISDKEKNMVKGLSDMTVGNYKKVNDILKYSIKPYNNTIDEKEVIKNIIRGGKDERY